MSVMTDGAKVGGMIIFIQTDEEEEAEDTTEMTTDEMVDTAGTAIGGAVMTTIAEMTTGEAAAVMTTLAEMTTGATVTIIARVVRTTAETTSRRLRR